MATSADDDAQDRLWLSQVADGGAPSRTAMQALFRKHYSRLVGTATRKLGLDPSLAGQLVQEALVRAFEKAAQFDQRSSVYTWLYRIALNGCIDHLRRSRRERTVDDEQWQAFEAGGLLTDDGSQRNALAVRQCIDRQFDLFAERHPRHAEALAKVYFEGLNARAAGAEQGRSHDAMRQFLVECYKKARVYLEPCRQLREH